MLLLALVWACTPACEAPGAICTVAGSGTIGWNGAGLPADETWLFWPGAVDLAPDGRLVLADVNNYVVRALEPDGTLSVIAGVNLHDYAREGRATASPLENPLDLSFGPDGGYAIAEQHAGRVLWVSADGALSFAAGSGVLGDAGDGGPATEAELSEICGVATAPDGAIYVADTDNHRVRRVRPDGIIEAVAGDGTPGLVDGSPGSFHAPQRLHLAGEHLYVADMGNHAIRRVRLSDGLVETVAGTGEAGYAGDGGPATDALLDTPVGVWVGGDGRDVDRRHAEPRGPPRRPRRRHRDRRGHRRARLRRRPRPRHPGAPRPAVGRRGRPRRARVDRRHPQQPRPRLLALGVISA